VLTALFFMNLLNYIDRYILAAVLEPVQETFQLNDKQGGLLTSAFFLSYVFFSPVTGWLGDRLTRKYLLAIGVGIWSLATFASGLTESYGALLLARAVLGIGEATYANLAPAMIADLFARDRRNRALAIFYVAIPIGAALGYVLGGFIVVHHRELHFLPWLESVLEQLTGQHFEEQSRGWRMAFFVVGLPGLVVAVAALFLSEPRRGASEGVDEEHLRRQETLPLSWDVYAALLRNRSYIYNTLGIAMFTFALGGLQVWAPKYLAYGMVAPGLEGEELKEALKVPLKGADFGLGVTLVLGGLIGTPLGSWLGDRWAQRVRGAYFWVLSLSILAAAPFILLALVGALFGWPLWLLLGFILVALILSSINYGPAYAILTNVTAPRIRAAALAVNTTLIHLLGDIPSPPVMGAISDLVRGSGATAAAIQHGLFWGLAATVPTLVASGLFFWLGVPHLEKDQEAVLRELQSDAA
jgi:MFS family permease